MEPTEKKTKTQQNSIGCSKDTIIDICDTGFCILESNKAEENKGMLNKAKDGWVDGNQLTRVKE